MSRSVYEIFKTKAFTLAKTLIVKHEETAVIMNTHMRKVQGYYVDDNNRWTWRYYMNLAGEYHQADRDELANINGNGVGMMTIRIADTNGSREVYFTKDLLHGPNADYALANEYTYDSRAYKDLLERYPNFENLILGILNPIDIDTAVLAPNHSILYCGDYFAKPYNSNYEDLVYELSDNVLSDSTRLIEGHEDNLISEIQQYISNTIFRWNTNEYIYVDNLYWATLIGTLYAYLPTVILNIRLANCLTERAHTFHITEFLESNGQLGRHVQNLPLDRALYLYRNVRYFNKNYGKESTFSAMVDNLLTPMRVPIAGYDATHDTVVMPESIYPKPYMIRDSINLNQIGTARDLRTVESIMTREIPLARENKRDLPERILETENILKQTQYNDLRSKVLESTMMDYSNSERYTLPELLFNMWIWSATHNRYRGTIYVTHPYSGERIQLTPANALVLFFYCVQRGVWEKPSDYPPVPVPRWIPLARTNSSYPTLESLQYITSGKCVTDSELMSLMTNVEPILNYGSTRIFHGAVSDIWKELNRRQIILYRTSDISARAQLENCLRRFYQFDIECPLLPADVTYDEWLVGLGVDFAHLGKDDLITLAMDIYIKSTGQDIDTRRSVADMQQSLLDIMKHFSSYTVQYLKGITFGSPINTDGKLLRLSDTAFNRGFGGLVGGDLELPKLDGLFVHYPRFGAVTDLQGRDTQNDPLINESGWVTRFGGSIALSGMNNIQLSKLHVHSNAELSNFNTTNLSIVVHEGAPTTVNLSSRPYPIYFSERLGMDATDISNVTHSNPYVSLNPQEAVPVTLTADVFNMLRRFPLLSIDYGSDDIKNSQDVHGEYRITAVDTDFDVGNVLIRFPLVKTGMDGVEVSTDFDVNDAYARSVLITTNAENVELTTELDVSDVIARDLAITIPDTTYIDINIDLEVGNVIVEGTLRPPYDLEGEYNP